MPPAALHAMGFSMILYPTTLLFRMTHAVQQGLEDLKAGRPLSKQDSVDMLEFERLVDIAYWKMIENQQLSVPERMRQLVNRLFRPAA